MAPNSCTTCEVCDESFDSEEHKPVVLPCGHTFCYCCVLKLDDSDEFSCPNCRKSWDVDVSELPVCYQLIPKEDEQSDEEEEEGDQCEDHNKKLTRWCCSCNCLLCAECYDLRHKSCNVLGLQSLINGESKDLLSVRDFLSWEVSAVEERMKDRLAESERQTDILNEFMERVTQMQDALKEDTDFLHASIIQLDLDKPSLKRRNSLSSAGRKYQMLVDCSRLVKLAENTKKFDDPLLENLCDFAQVFEKVADTTQKEAPVFLDQYLESCCHPMEACGDWVIENDTQAHVAHKALASDKSLRPFEVTFKSISKPIYSAKLLLPLFAANVQSLNLQFLDAFWQETEDFFPDSNDAMLENLLESPERSKLRHFIGCVSHRTLQKLKALELYTLGLHVYSHGFLKSINNLLHPIVPVYHLCIQRRVKPKGLPALALHLYTLSCVHLHFPDLGDDDLDWLSELVVGLVPSGYHDYRVQSICLPRCRLTADGLLALFDHIFRLDICPDVNCQHEGLTAAARQAVSREAARERLQLNWSIDFL